MTAFETTQLPVRSAVPKDGEALVEILSAAFADDPVFRWWVPDPARRRTLTPAVFRIAVASNLPHGEVYAAEAEAAAVAVWQPPGLEMTPEAEKTLIDQYVTAAEENADRLMTILDLTAEVHPREPHAYLFLLAALPQRQGSGLGSALLRHVLGRCDRDGTPAYLEASSEHNRRLYVRHGFADIGLIRLPDGPPMWQMWRSPRA